MRKMAMTVLALALVGAAPAQQPADPGGLRLARRGERTLAVAPGETGLAVPHQEQPTGPRATDRRHCGGLVSPVRLRSRCPGG